MTKTGRGGNQSTTRALSSASGPRTPEGKKRSSRNALKHGIFSSALVLENESPEEFASLVSAMSDQFKPEGAMENLLVEKLAMILWRHRRLIQAERAEIETKTRFLAWERKQELINEVGELLNPPDFEAVPGLLTKRNNVLVLEQVLQLLHELKENIQEDGLSPDADAGILRRIYGNETYLTETLHETYNAWATASEASDEERKQEGLATPDECKRQILKAIDNEIASLKRDQKLIADIEAERIDSKKLRDGIPRGEEADRLMRYEASLERAFERTLNQLERLQRTRLGQPVLPPVRVQVEH